MGYAILHLEKAKGTDSGMSAHIERTFSPSNVDSSRSYLNRELISYPPGVKNRTQAITYRLEHAGIKRKIGSNQVRAIRVLLTASHDAMIKIEQDGLLQDWLDDNLFWLRKTFGAENIISAVVHCDECTVHIHATITPIVTGTRRKKKSEKDYNKKCKSDTIRLCADDVMSRSKLKSYQDSYALLMTKYGLKRGLEGSIAKHISTSEYYKQLIGQSEELELSIKELHSQKNDMDIKLSQVKSEIHMQELRKSATNATIAITNTVASVFGSGKLKKLENDNDSLQKEILKKNIVIGNLENKLNMVHAEYCSKLEREKTEQKRLESIIAKAYRWFPQFAELIQLEKIGLNIGLSTQQFTEMVKGNIISYTGKLFAPRAKLWFDVKEQKLSIEKNDNKMGIYVGNQHINQWFTNFMNRLNVKTIIEEQKRKRTIRR